MQGYSHQLYRRLVRPLYVISSRLPAADRRRELSPVPGPTLYPRGVRASLAKTPGTVLRLNRDQLLATVPVAPRSVGLLRVQYLISVTEIGFVRTAVSTPSTHWAYHELRTAFIL